MEGVNSIGGLVGHNFGNIILSYAQVEGNGDSYIKASYTHGKVAGGTLVGSLAGYHGTGKIGQSYVAVAVSGLDNLGSLVGLAVSPTQIEGNCGDSDMSGQADDQGQNTSALQSGLERVDTKINSK